MNGWSIARLATYMACLGAAGLAMAGMADFNWQTGDFDLHPLNVYELGGAFSGLVSAGLASLAVLRGWGGSK